MDHLPVTYRLEAAPGEAAALAEALLLEQTVETPRRVAERHAFVREHLLGHIREILPDEKGGTRVTLALPLPTASADPSQFLNVLFGNTSLQPDVTLEDFEVPPALHALFRGPRFGLAGLRERTGVPTRPLTATALKPVGLSVDTLAALCRTFAEGGIDLIKDDHYLADHAFCPFEERVRACQAAVDEVEARTGHRTLYLPNLSGTPDQVHRQADLAQQIGVRAVMAAPMLLGLPAFYDLIHTRLEVPVLAHPSFAGGLRIRPATLLGKLFRLFGADAVIFPNYGGRFHFSREQCAGIARTLRADWGPYRPAFPVPAGGMNVERVPELITFFGLDTVLLIGGSLLEAGQALRERTQALVASVEQAARQYRATAEERG
ncbi:MAG: RuBisCO large subunit C-terminal-like domain-containing protein [Rhodothermales bacterium]